MRRDRSRFMKARERRRWMVACIVLSMLAIGSMRVRDAAADEPAALGWWWVGRPTATFPAGFSPKPDVPAGGLYVSGTAAGPSGVSAMRFLLGPDAVDPVLSIAIAESIRSPHVQACATGAPWESTSDGAWDERPSADCEAGAVVGSTAADGSTITFDLRSLQNGRTLDIVLLPGAESELGSTFSASFHPPGPDALLVRRQTGRVAAPIGPPPPLEPIPQSQEKSVPGSGAASQPTIESAGAVPTPNPPFAPPVAAVPTRTGFAYPVVLVLPLAFLVLGSYLARALTRPIVIRVHSRADER